jgi:hypothetical protein
MNKKLLASLVAVGLLAGGESASAMAAVGAPAAPASTAAVAVSTAGMHSCGPLGSLITKGTITKAQATDIHNAFVNYVSDHWQAMVATVLGQLVKQHTITAAQASSVTAEITHWVQNSRGNGSDHAGYCHHSMGEGMKGDSGNQ